MKLILRQKITIAFLTIYWITLVIVTHISIPSIVYKARVSDKWLHFMAFLNLVFLLWFSLKPDEKVKWRNRLVWLLLLGVCIYSWLDELTQPYFCRTCDFYDFLSNVIAAITGFCIITFLSFWQALPVFVAVTIFGLTNLAKTNLSKLVPFVVAVFHVVAYASFTLSWIQFMRIELPRISDKWRLLAVIIVPVCLLVVVKAASLLLGRHFAATDFLFGFLGICSVIIISYFSGFIHLLSKPDLKGV